MPSWNWDEEAASEGVGHYSKTNTDYSDPASMQQAYDYVNFSEIGPTPVACWPLHEDSGTTANDVAGANDGTYIGPTLGQAGPLGTTAPSFDGTDDYVDVSGLSIGSAYTVTAWAYWNNNNDGDDDLICEFEDGGNILLYGGGDGTVVYLHRLSDDSYIPIIGEVSDITWTFLAAVWDGSETELFIDAVSQGTASAASTASQSNGTYIGQRVIGGRNMDGKIADVRYYNTALTPPEIQALYDVVDSPGDWLGAGKLL